jgi:S-adenosylmethionine:tRNA ribosyltransferase-isomerase
MDLLTPTFAAMMHPGALRMADFHYHLPHDRIAQEPAAQRDGSRLLMYRDGVIAHYHFRDLAGLLPHGSLLVLNDTRVVNARLHFRKPSGAAIELFCLGPAQGLTVEQGLAARGEVHWCCKVGNARRWKEGLLVREFGTDQDKLSLTAERTGDTGEGQAVRLGWQPAHFTFAEVLQRAGEVPLPPYIDHVAGTSDAERYQTVYAQRAGSVAAPTAGLHMSPQLLAALGTQGVGLARVTLHVGAGTFTPVHAETLADHAMHSEEVQVTRKELLILCEAIGQRPIVALGTTSLRTLESLFWHGVALLRGTAVTMEVDQWQPYTGLPLPTAREALHAVLLSLGPGDRDALFGRTSLLIAPGYSFQVADALVTNFHQPGSTLLLLVAAFVGEGWKGLYASALDQGYGFLSYGDASLLWRKPTAAH